MQGISNKIERNSLSSFTLLWSRSGLVTALLCGASAASYAQNDNPAAETVVVSASRITASGFAAPTPTTVIGARDIEQNAQPNIFTTINQLPSLQGSINTQSGTAGTSLGNNGLSSFSSRNLGTIRTLTLIDSQRVVPANVTGIADVSEFPQLLIQRVDVVTGGASASWGSDAVGGVINFVTNKNFNGIKGNIQGGMSAYGDETNGIFQLAAGSGFFGGKGHIEAAGEFYRNDGIPVPYIPGGALANGRCCSYNPGTLTYNLNSTLGVNGSTPVAGTNTYNPQNTRIVGAQPNQTSEYGLITSTALAGLAFHADGTTLSPFQYGSAPAGYTPVGATGVAACVGTTCVGGDLTNTTIRSTVDDPITRSVFYSRVSYNLTPQIELFGTYTFGNVFTTNSPGPTPNSGLTLFCGNAAGGPNFYLTAAVNAACVTNKVTSFKFGVSYDKFPPIHMSLLRQMRRYVGGADGDFTMFGSDWTFDSYIEHGENDTSIHIRNVPLVPHYNAGLDAVAGPNGSVICRLNLTTIQAPGCVPFPIMGGASLSPEALAYADPTLNGPYSLTYERQEAASFSINGKPFRDWAGDVVLAAGVEYREENYVTKGDPYADGVSAANPATAAYPLDPTLDLVNGGNWRAGNYHSGKGNYHVVEGFVETGIPLIDDGNWGKADLNLAGRATDYSTSGYVSTWKVGVTWDTPLNGIRLRALQSRDVRAPNLSELFAAPIIASQFVTDRTLPASAPQINIQNRAVGNPNLVPEKAANTEVGVVYQPDYIAGFSMSVDYYRVAIKDQIGSLTNQQIVDLCQLQGNTSYCGFFFLKGTPGTSNPSYVTVAPFNLAQTTADGFDIEASYQFNLEDWDIPGGFVVRGLASHVSKFISNTGVAGQPISEAAGTNADPLWKLNLSQSWRTDLLSVSVTERYFSNGVINPYGIVCGVGSCPAPTAQHPTYSAMNTPGNLYVDIGGTYKLSSGLEAYMKVDNVADRLPGPIVGAGSDTIGRVYRFGMRFNN